MKENKKGILHRLEFDGKSWWPVKDGKKEQRNKSKSQKKKKRKRKTNSIVATRAQKIKKSSSMVCVHWHERKEERKEGNNITRKREK